MSVQQFRSLVWVDYILYAIVDPRALARLIMRTGGRFMPISLLVPAGVALFEIVALSLLSKQSTFFLYKVSYGWIASSLVVIVMMFAAASLIDLFLQLSGKAGRIAATVTCVSFSQFPRLFLLPLVAIAAAPHTIVTAPIAVYVIGSIALSVWSIINIISGVSEIYEIPVPKACASVLVPMGLVAVIGVIILVLSGIIFAGALQSLFMGFIR
jgi:hypothetical protein